MQMENITPNMVSLTTVIVKRPKLKSNFNAN